LAARSGHAAAAEIAKAEAADAAVKVKAALANLAKKHGARWLRQVVAEKGLPTARSAEAMIETLAGSCLKLEDVAGLAPKLESGKQAKEPGDAAA
jgi:hypothetical protein